MTDRNVSLAVLATALVVGLTGCGDDEIGPGSDAGSGSSDGGGGMDAESTSSIRVQVLANLGQNVILPSYRAFVPRADALVTAVSAYAMSPDATTRAAAQASWEQAIDTWQELEMMQLGPLAAMDLAAGGADVRDSVYAWPELNLCVIDQMTASEDYDDQTALAAEPINTRGLGAIEYLLYVPDTDNRCSPLSGINMDGTWDAFSDAEVERRRARHAEALATLVQQQATSLVTRWEATDGNFLAELTDPGRSGSLYGDAQEGLNAVSDAMFYLDKETKDMKLAEPAGISGCDAASCPDARESRFANRSREHVIANLRGFQRLYLGSEPTDDGLGFDDLLVNMGADALATQMTTRIADAIIAAEGIDPTLVEAVDSGGTSVADTHEAIRLITDDLKTMFVSVLDLEVPNRAAGDND